MRLGTWQTYITSNRYLDGLQATKSIWSQVNTFALSGLYVHMNLFPIPALMEIETKSSSRFQTVEGMLTTLAKTSQFLHSLVGAEEEGSPLEGGIKNERVRALVEAYRLSHGQIANLIPWMSDYICQIVTYAPLNLMRDPDVDKTKLYLEYMTNAWELMGAELKDHVQNERGLLVEDTARNSPELSRHLSTLYQAYASSYGHDQAREFWKRATESLPSPIQRIIATEATYAESIS